MRELTAETSPVTHAIIGAAIEVHKELGPGFLEVVYQQAFSKELARRGVPHQREIQVGILYKGELLDATYRVDFLVQDVVVELKAIAGLGRIEEAPVIHYLKASGHKTGLLLDFGSLSLQVRRLANRIGSAKIVDVDPST